MIGQWKPSRIRSRRRVEEQMGWLDDYQPRTGWRRLPNPELGAARRARRARIILWCIVLSLPFSLISCLVSLTAANNSNQKPPITPTPTPQPTAWVPASIPEAENIVWKWLVSTGRFPTRVTSVQQSIVGCDSASTSGCELHSVLAIWTDGSSLPVSVLMNDAQELEVGPWIEGSYSGDNLIPLDTNERRRRNDNARSGWSTDIRQLFDQWALAWVRGDQEQLQLLARSADRSEFHTAPDGWIYVDRSVRPGPNAPTNISSDTSWDTWIPLRIDLISSNCAAIDDPQVCSDTPITTIVEARLQGGADENPRIVGSRLPGTPDAEEEEEAAVIDTETTDPQVLP